MAQFLKDILEGVVPSVALGRDSTMLKEILDKTAERVGKDLKDQPEVEAELRSTIGTTYCELGEWQRHQHRGGTAFLGCASLQGVFFKGNAPGANSSVFHGDNNVTVYYLPGTTGWGPTFAGVPTRLWNPLMQTSGPGFGVGPAGFGFNITGTADISIVVEAATTLANAAWVPLQSLNLTNGAFHFSDPNWTNYPARNYRIRSP